ncbi:putative dehydrogenase [Rhizobium leguminosarum bv. trifolii WSM2297]|uniref:Putative dehydrogenase n=1 Tax=Rhizobium leguminosarum bv. trifolii WSM2297 TaxID=754762 RepID=J0CZA0_RHILT|nr:Gfo/Idh/MocA family oxidoreductase [Rhizobium leguminosarum]EJC85335.1 putative dehydrogenase [Rhizobium leguminosarum bv. trifolii WSM2297]EJC85781.1 putative dehydrogenase [Rhizobium leguminosarum bv. trifolii WSM2297]
MTQTPIGVGIIGVHPDRGWASTAHVPALRDLPQFRLSALSHNRIEVAQAAAQKFGFDHAVSSTEELVSHPDVDLVVVTVRVPEHLQLVTSALEAGKSVFSEWPLGMNLRDAEAMNRLAASKGVRTMIGLQTRANPTIRHIRKLVAEGYVGEVLSATVIGSGITWGEELEDAFRYTLDPSKGASMVHVPFAHTMDALAFALDDEFISASATLVTRRATIRIVESQEAVPLAVADQIAFTGRLASGALVISHFRGGLSRATNFHLEINGSKGDLLLTSPVGYVGIGGFNLSGAQVGENLHPIPVPSDFGPDDNVLTGNVKKLYELFASDLLSGTRHGPTFESAVKLHRLINAVEKSRGASHEI